MGSNAIYNEIEPFACAWLEQLVAAGHVGPGAVERRSVADLSAADVSGHGQRHFFAGIGVWSAALRSAGVPDDADVWTGSCPCQPFSAAGKRGGVGDARHLWPEWFRLIAQCRPAIVFGEQVASRDGLGWLDAVRADLEGAGYAFGASDLCAAGVGAPHIRQRLYFVAYADGQQGRLQLSQREPQREDAQARQHGEARELANSMLTGRPEGRTVAGFGSTAGSGGAGQLGDSNGESGRWDGRAVPRAQGDAKRSRQVDGRGTDGPGVSGMPSFWSDAEWIPCTDGRLRPVEPGTFPLAHGATNRVGRLRGYGNAIVRQVAATFIRASLEAIESQR